MSVVTFAYDTSYYPAAPVIEIEIDGYDARLGQRQLQAMLDSGADATMIPLQTLEAIGATYYDTRWMRGVTGNRIEIDRYLVSIQIGSHLIHGLHVIAGPQNSEAVIGRDALNQLVIKLDGPAEVTEVINN